MNTIQMRIAGAGVLLILVILSGIWVSRSGKPYRTAPFTIHKLVGLAAGVLLAAVVYQAHQMALLGLLEMVSIVITILLFLAIVAAGGLLSAERSMPGLVLRLHQILPVLALLSTVATLYLLFYSG